MRKIFASIKRSANKAGSILAGLLTRQPVLHPVPIRPRRDIYK